MEQDFLDEAAADSGGVCVCSSVDGAPLREISQAWEVASLLCIYSALSLAE